MKSQQKSGIRLICLALLIVIATLVSAGCLASTPDPQSQTTATHDQQSKNPAASTAVTTRTTTAPAPLKTTTPAPAPGLSTAGVAIGPIGDKKTGEHFLLTAATSLPLGTEVMWQILPDTGSPPTGLDGASQMSLTGNNLVTKGDGTSNRISQDVDLGRLVPGKYVVIVGEKKGNEFEIGNRYGYTYFTLK